MIQLQINTQLKIK